MMGLASFLISIPAILLLWMSFSSNKPYECKWGEGERQKRGEEEGVWGRGRREGVWERGGGWEDVDARNQNLTKSILRIVQ